MAKISLEAHGVEWGAEFLRQRNLQTFKPSIVQLFHG